MKVELWKNNLCYSDMSHSYETLWAFVKFDRNASLTVWFVCEDTQ